MTQVAEQLMAVTRKCVEILPTIMSSVAPVARSKATEAEYLRLAEALIRRSGGQQEALVHAIQDTERSTTFYKRLAALRFSCLHRMTLYCDQLHHVGDVRWHKLLVDFGGLLLHMRALVALQQLGMGKPRQRRRSKRKALKGLPADWRIRLCQRGTDGKYALALLVGGLSGARPSELVKGVEVHVETDSVVGDCLISLHIKGTKVKEGQGLTHRCIRYPLSDSNPLVAALAQKLRMTSAGKETVSIKHAGNFSKEVQRLARALWPDHKEAVTAYCLRHQWAADIKAGGDRDAVTHGLGHRSVKTARFYGTANQSKGFHRLCPISVDAELSPGNAPTPPTFLHL